MTVETPLPGMPSPPEVCPECHEVVCDWDCPDLTGRPREEARCVDHGEVLDPTAVFRVYYDGHLISPLCRVGYLARTTIPRRPLSYRLPFPSSEAPGADPT